MAKPQDNISCDTCGKVFTKRLDKIAKHINHFCCNSCRVDFQKHRIEVACVGCGIKLFRIPSRLTRNENQYCSIECANKGRVTYDLYPCKQCGKLVKKHIYILNKNKNKNVFCSVVCNGKFHTRKNKTYSEERQQLRRTEEYKTWRFVVMRERGFKCEKCGCKGKQYNLHHIKSFVKYKELQMERDNVSLLCEDCHKEFHILFGKHRFTDTDYYNWNNIMRCDNG